MSLYCTSCRLTITLIYGIIPGYHQNAEKKKFSNHFFVIRLNFVIMHYPEGHCHRPYICFIAFTKVLWAPQAYPFYFCICKKWYFLQKAKAARVYQRCHQSEVISQENHSPFHIYSNFQSMLLKVQVLSLSWPHISTIHHYLAQDAISCHTFQAFWFTLSPSSTRDYAQTCRVG